MFVNWNGIERPDISQHTNGHLNFYKEVWNKHWKKKHLKKLFWSNLMVAVEETNKDLYLPAQKSTPRSSKALKMKPNIMIAYSKKCREEGWNHLPNANRFRSKQH